MEGSGFGLCTDILFKRQRKQVYFLWSKRISKAGTTLSTRSEKILAYLIINLESDFK
jgi:hypothetical protein